MFSVQLVSETQQGAFRNIMNRCCCKCIVLQCCIDRREKNANYTSSYVIVGVWPMHEQALKYLAELEQAVA